MLRVQTEHMGPIAVIRLRGDIDEEGATDLRIALVTCLRERRYNVVVNLAEVEFVSFMGVGILVERLRQFRANEGDMKLVSLNIYTQRLFRRAGITTLFETFEEENEAIQVYRQAA